MWYQVTSTSQHNQQQLVQRSQNCQQQDSGLLQGVGTGVAVARC